MSRNSSIAHLHPRSLKPICEMQLFHEPIDIPENCEIRYFELSKSIFHKLKNTKEWLYITKAETISITCDNENNSVTYHLKWVGRVGILGINETCKAYSSRDILVPSRRIKGLPIQHFVHTTQFNKDDRF